MWAEEKNDNEAYLLVMDWMCPPQFYIEALPAPPSPPMW